MTQNIPLEELARLPNFYGAVVSWKRDKVAFYWDKNGRIELYVLDIASGDISQVSKGEVPRSPKSGLIWTRDDQAIIYGKDFDGNEQNDQYLITVEDGTVTQLTNDPESSEFAIEVSPDNEWLLMATNRFGQMNLARVRLDDPKSYEALTHFSAPVFSGLWHPDGSKVLIGANESENPLNSDVYVLDLESGEHDLVWQEKAGAEDEIRDVSKNGRFLAITTNAYGLNRAGVFDMETNTVRWFGEEGVNEAPAGFSENGRFLACVRNQDAELKTVLYDVESGEEKVLNLPSGLTFAPQFVNNDTALVITLTTSNKRPELILYDLETDSYCVLLSADYGSINPDVFVPSEHIWYDSFDGKQIPALIHVPKDIAEGEKRPAVMIIHGGPTAQFFQAFDPYAQFLVDQGYVVFKPNVRGSTGYGVDFRDSNIQDLGGGDLEDVAHGAYYLKRLPFVDGERLGIFGGSYGGYMTYIALTKKPEIFKTGSAAVGITDWILLNEESMEHFKYYIFRLWGDPEENKALLADRSAINFAHKLKAKLQIIHGVNDPRCPISQARTFRDKLLDLGYKEGADFEYEELGAQGHGSADQEQKVVWYTLLVDFLARTL